MILYVIRHAWAEPSGDPRWPNDADRPLTAQGQERMARVVQTLAARGVRPELVASSPLVRCRQTAEIVVHQGAGHSLLVEREELQPQSDLKGMVAWTAREGEGREQVAWVGHAPDVGEMTAALIGQPGAAIHFAKGAVAAICFDGPPEIGRGELEWLVTAKILGC